MSSAKLIRILSDAVLAAKAWEDYFVNRPEHLSSAWHNKYLRLQRDYDKKQAKAVTALKEGKSR